MHCLLKLSCTLYTVKVDEGRLSTIEACGAGAGAGEAGAKAGDGGCGEGGGGVVF